MVDADILVQYLIAAIYILCFIGGFNSGLQR
jgi:hypothetical protein